MTYASGPVAAPLAIERNKKEYLEQAVADTRAALAETARFLGRRQAEVADADRAHADLREDRDRLLGAVADLARRLDAQEASLAFTNDAIAELEAAREREQGIVTISPAGAPEAENG